jgi:hypothetical protein
MHLRILPEHQKHQNFFFFKKDIFDRQSEKNVFWCICAYFFFKDIFYRLEWLKTCFDAFAHTCRPPETFSKKIFLPSGVVKDGFLMHFHILPDHQKLFFKKDILNRLEWLKAFFDGFAHTSRPPETFFQKRYFWTSGVVKNVFWCIFAYFQTTRIMFLKKIFF